MVLLIAQRNRVTNRICSAGARGTGVIGLILTKTDENKGKKIRYCGDDGLCRRPGGLLDGKSREIDNDDGEAGQGMIMPSSV